MLPIDNEYDTSRIIRGALAGLQPREERVIRCLYGLGKVGFCPGEQTLDEVGKELSVTKERIRQIKFKALRKMRRSISLALARKAAFKIPFAQVTYHHPSAYKAPIKRAPYRKIARPIDPKWAAEVAESRARERREIALAYLPDTRPEELIAAVGQFEAMAGNVVSGATGPITRSGHRYFEVINDWVEFRSDGSLLLSLNKDTNQAAVAAWLSTVMKLASEIPHGTLHWRIKPYLVYPGRVYSRFVITKNDVRETIN